MVGGSVIFDVQVPGIVLVGSIEIWVAKWQMQFYELWSKRVVESCKLDQTLKPGVRALVGNPVVCTDQAKSSGKTSIDACRN